MFEAHSGKRADIVLTPRAPIHMHAESVFCLAPSGARCTKQMRTSRMRGEGIYLQGGPVR
eukprot:8317920-Pyramimonas_sp.AAC.1